MAVWKPLASSISAAEPGRDRAVEPPQALLGLKVDHQSLDDALGAALALVQDFPGAAEQLNVGEEGADDGHDPELEIIGGLQ